MEKNSFLDSLKRETNYTLTENGGIAHKSTLDAVYDMFALGGAYRSRTDEDCILLFKNALEENEELALKCLFYLRDIRCGQGERRFFRVCFKWLAKNYPELAFRNLDNIPEYGRWDDLYCVEGTELRTDAFDVIQCQLNKDLMSLKEGEKEGVSLLGKWLKSENASAEDTKYLANQTRIALRYSHKKYRKILSALRSRINIVEKLMSEGKWEEIQYAKLPSRAGLIYRNAFARRDIISQKYKNFIQSNDTKVNAKTLYPYNIIKDITKYLDGWRSGIKNIPSIERETLEKYWNNLPNYIFGKNQSILCVVDTSGSMTYGNSITPIDVAISLGIYAGERCEGPFKNHYISFSSRPQLIEIQGIDLADKVNRIYQTNLCENTNLNAVFDLLKETALQSPENAKSLPNTIIVISDMEIDSGSKDCYWNEKREQFKGWTTESAATEMEKIRTEWAAAGLTLPNLVYWNVDARNNTILDSGDSVSFVSGYSSILFESICKGVKGIEIMYEKLLSDRYKNIHI